MAGQMQDANVASQGIHLYPVAPSGVDELTEHTMRSAAQLTGGRCLFFADDSGVKAEHKEPSIPCYFVTQLDDATLRMLDIEMSSSYFSPDPGNLIRTGGDPQEGECTLRCAENSLVHLLPKLSGPTSDSSRSRRC